MKKNLLVIAAAVASAFTFNACEEGQTMDLFGSINLVATNPVDTWTGLTQPYADSTVLNFGSALCNVDIDSVMVGDGEDSVSVYDVYAGTIMVGTTQNLLSNDVANLTFPMCGVNLRDTVTGTYEISCPIDQFSFYQYLDTTNVNSLITSGLEIGDELGNIFAVAVSEDAFYLGYSGTITITSFADHNYRRVEGTVNNVNAVYVTADQIAALAQMPEEQRADIDLASYLPHITFSGTISSMRANIGVILEALEEAGEE